VLMRMLQDGNLIGDDGARRLGDLLKVNSSLQQLILVSFLFWCCCVFEQHFMEIAERWLGSLTRVLQINNQIGDDGARGLGEGLNVNSSLQWLHLVSSARLLCFFLWRRCRRGMGGVGGASAGLMRVLQDGNLIGDDGARGLGEGLKVNSSLQQLVLVSLFFCVSLSMLSISWR
jgi:hypothetical protein